MRKQKRKTKMYEETNQQMNKIYVEGGVGAGNESKGH